MMRIAKRTSPMSIGTWVLLAFTTFAGGASGAQLAADFIPARRNMLERVAALFTLPAALFGFGLSTYTAALLSATSTPLWAASPRTLAGRFGSSAIAAGAAALSIGEQRPAARRALDRIAFLALGTEAVAAALAHKDLRAPRRRRGARQQLGPAGALGRQRRRHRAPRWPCTAASAVLPAPVGRRLSRRRVRRDPGRQRIAAHLDHGCRATCRPTTPAISFRFSQPENLPKNR